MPRASLYACAAGRLCTTSAMIASGAFSPHGAGLPRLSLRMRCPAASSSWARRSTGPRMSYRTFLSLFACATMDPEYSARAGYSGQAGGQLRELVRHGEPGRGHREPEDAAAARVGLDADRAAVQRDDPAGHGQAQARTREALRRRRAVERREDALAVLLRDADAPV